MEKVTNERVQNSYHSAKHPSSLHTSVYPEEGSNSIYAIFGTRCGSVDTSFRRSDEQGVSTVPRGVVHFLEHRLSGSEDGDAFARYAKTGASTGAYTSLDMVCYLFSCTENMYESPEILLDFVQSPYFTGQTVQKEQGIIGQETRVYDDDPQWRVMFDLLKTLYHHHPVKIDIADTVESIVEITPKYLYRCYHTFCNPNNMALCVAGNIDPEHVLELYDKMLKPSEPTQVEHIFEKEPTGVVQDRVKRKLSITIPPFQLGFREPARRRNVRELAQTDVLLELLTSDASPLCRRLSDQDLINTTSFGSKYFEEPGYTAVVLSGGSKNPDTVAREIRDEIERLREEGILAEAFERARKAVYGRNMAAFNSVGAIVNAMISLTFAERELFSCIGALATVQLPDAQKRLEEQLFMEDSVLSVVFPAR